MLDHFDDSAKRAMLEMVTDIREEFARILDEVRGNLHLMFARP